MQVTPYYTDPLDNSWEALAQAGYAPHGKPYDFRSRCPVHGGNSADALHVSVGCDGSAVMWCFVCGVTGDAVMTALGRPCASYSHRVTSAHRGYLCRRLNEVTSMATPASSQTFSWR